MNGEQFHGRRVLSKGMENTVLEPLNGDMGIILKVPRPLNYLSMIGKDQAHKLRKELKEAQDLVEGTEVKIPRTLIMRGKEKNVLGVKTTAYVMGQEFIFEDGTVPHIDEYLTEQELPTLADEYAHEPRNFVSNNGSVYWIDPMKGTVGRALEDIKIMDLESYRNVRRKLSKVIRFLRL